MLPVTPSRRLAAQAGLVAAPALFIVSAITQPDLGDSAGDRLDAAGSTSAAVSSVTFLVGQLPLLVAFLAIGLLLVERAPKLSAWGTALAVVGCFGHAVFGGMSMLELLMARSETGRSTHVALIERAESSPVMAFAAAGLLGTVLGFLVLSIGLFRSRTGPVWVGPVLWAFLVVEFVGSNLSEYAMYASSLLLAIAFLGLVPVVAGRSDDVDETDDPSYALQM
ncbi:MAG TPA: hypothetical protein VFK34_09815 [Marmoricola sp.]|jgi:hypothetical protein|nr:hypothetical protein [Marmoricola sp.]